VRYTKAEMLRDMELARAFHLRPFMVVAPSASTAVESRRFFIPVAQYGRAMSLVAVEGELGCDTDFRYKSNTRRKK